MTDELPGAGPELDAMVIEALGRRPDYLFRPSTMAEDAFWALETWREQHEGSSWNMNYSYVVKRYGCSIQASWRVFVDEAPTLPVAICHAILRATREVQS